MRRWRIAVPMLTLCLLCACGGKTNDPLQAPMDYRTDLLANGGCAFELDARVETGDRLWELSLDCELDANGDGTVKVLAPESIAGIAATVSGDGAAPAACVMTASVWAWGPCPERSWPPLPRRGGSSAPGRGTGLPLPDRRKMPCSPATRTDLLQSGPGLTPNVFRFVRSWR